MTSQKRAVFVKECQKKLGMQSGLVVTYSDRHLEASHLSLFNQRELESLDIQFAFLTVTWMPLPPISQERQRRYAKIFELFIMID